MGAARKVTAKDFEACSHCGSVLQLPRADEKEGPTADDRWVFVGMTGTGKSTRHKELMAEWLKRGRAIVCWDVDDEYSQRGKKRPGVVLGPLRDRVTYGEFMADKRIITAADLSLAVVPDDPDEMPELVAAQFMEFCPAVKARGNCILALDEMGYWAQASPRCAEKLNTIATKWRKEGVAVSAAAQFLVQIPAGFRSQMTRLIAFKQAKSAHLRLLAEETSAEFARLVRRLKKYQSVSADVWDEPSEKE